MSIIETKDLTKKFRDLVAVDHVSLTIEAGECFGLLGPNGAGKTSLIRMIIGVSPPNEGTIRVLGGDPSDSDGRVRAALGVAPQLDNLDPDLTVLQNLTTFARYFDIPRAEARRRAEEVLTLFELTGKSKSQIRELSGGMKRRLILARSLINRPKVLVFDEPTIGLDPQARHLVWDKLQELRSQGTTELLCTQNMDEAEVLCDRMAIMHQGKILSVGSTNELVKRYVGSEVWEAEIPSGDGDRVTSELKRAGFDFESYGRKVHIFRLEDKTAGGSAIAGLTGLVRRPATLEDVFFRLTGRSLAE